MKLRPILFSTPMVQAILRGQKTQTRRIVKPQPTGGLRTSPFTQTGYEDKHGYPLKPCPYGYEGDQLWVRETYTETENGILYKADNPRIEGIKWKSPIFMPRQYSRIILNIKEIRVQRLEQISRDDAHDEGFNCRADFFELFHKLNPDAPENPFVWVIHFQAA